MPTTCDERGRLVSIEGLNGVGKTYLTTRVIEAALTRGEQPPQVIEDFTSRTGADTDLGRRLLRALITASDGERFLRAGYPKSETLLLLAIKMHDYEAALPALHHGRTVIEGRSLHSTAVYQSLIMESDDDAAFVLAGQILGMAGRWRPLPDLTIVLTDDVEAAVGRAETRNGEPFTAEQWQLHGRAATLFEQLADADPQYIRLLDRRRHNADALVDIITAWIAEAPVRHFRDLLPAPAGP